ncbi:MAG: GNAT family N-acetyltransferase [Burkholderiaceae bacterium]|nr:GNAT family N-acetyltransferase [Burkholderiaceae bacterium]
MIANHQIELARAADTAYIAALSKDAIEHGLTWSWTPQRVLRSVQDVATNTIVAKTGGVLAGFAIMKYRDEDAHLLLMAVDASHRRGGVGSALVQWLETTVQMAGIRTIRVEARENNVIARAFYKALGYRETQVLRGYYEGRDDAVVLKKTMHS